MKTVTHPAVKDIRLEHVLYALSDPVRLAVVQELDKKGQMTCGEFSNVDKKGKSTMTHHFKVLRDCGIINTKIEGREHITTLRCEDLQLRFPGLLSCVLLAAKSPKRKAPASALAK